MLDYLFPILATKDQWPIKGQKIKKKHLAPTASTAGTCLSVISKGNDPMSKVPRHLHQVNCFQEGMLAFDGPKTVFQQIFDSFTDNLGRGDGGEAERYGIDRKNKSK